MKQSSVRFLSMAAIPVIVIALFFVVYFAKKSQEVSSLPDYGTSPTFQLIDQNNQVFDANSLMGEPWILSFLFTRCPDQCPLMVSKLAKLSKQIPDMRFVSITADPDFDTPEVITQYVQRSIGPKNWSYLTGEKEIIQKIALGFMTAAPDNPGLHTTRFILVDGAGHIRGFYDSQSKEQLYALAHDVKSL